MFRLSFPPLDQPVQEMAIACHPYGSRYVCPELATEDTDTDWLVLVSDIVAVTEQLCDDHGFAYCENEDYETNDSRLRSLRRGTLNVVLVDSVNLFEKAVTATELCRCLKVTDRDNRILVHDVIERGLYFDPVFGWH